MGIPELYSRHNFSSRNIDVHLMLNLHLRYDVLVKKLLGRRFCPQCDHSYNLADINDGEYIMPAWAPKKN